MNSNPNDTVVTCHCCKKNLATTTYTNRSGQFSESVCASCLDFWQMREAFEWGIVDSRPLAEEERYDEILAWIDTFEKANHNRDQDGWLAKAVARYRALTLWEAQRYEEALQICNIIEQLGFKDVTDRWGLGLSRARNYEGLEKHAEALAVFEAAFREQDQRYSSGARYFMTSLVEFSANAGKPVDESWRHVIENVAHEYEVEFPVRPTLGESILALFEMTENMRSKQQREQDEAHGK